MTTALFALCVVYSAVVWEKRGELKHFLYDSMTPIRLGSIVLNYLGGMLSDIFVKVSDTNKNNNN